MNKFITKLLPEVIYRTYSFKTIPSLFIYNTCHENNYWKSKCVSYNNFRFINFQPVYYNQEDVKAKFSALKTAYTEFGRVRSSYILDIINNANSELYSDDECIFLLQCCGFAIPDKTQQVKHELCEKLLDVLEKRASNLKVQFYNEYLRICIENRIPKDFQEFLSRMKCQPDETTYRLLLNSACEMGDVQQALQIIEAIKNNNFSANEQIFNALLLGHAIRGGLTNALTVLQTMQTVHVIASSASYNAIIRGIVFRKDFKEFTRALKMFQFIVDDDDLLKLLMALGINGCHDWLENIIKVIGPVQISKQNMRKFNLLCINLIYLGYPNAAMTFYKSFVKSSEISNDETYALFLLIEMLLNNTPTNTIINIVNELQSLDSNSNNLIMEKLAGVALKIGYTEVAWQLLERLSVLRPHYFWALLLQAGKSKAEIGVLNIIIKMLKWNVKPDEDTLEYYCVPFCDTTNSEQLVLRLQNLGLTIRDIFTPLLAFLLKENRLVDVENLCKSFNVSTNSKRLLQPLINVWLKDNDINVIVNILKKICKSAEISDDYAGHFSIKVLKTCRSPASYERFLNILERMYNAKLQISSSNADTLMYLIKSSKHNFFNISKTESSINKLINTTINENNTYMKHPRSMDVTELEDHLIELTNKNMETRGVLRRLIQEHCRLGHQQRAIELRDKFITAGYNETPGMKGALLQLHVVNQNTDEALNMYTELKSTFPSFNLDDFKVLDLAHLLVVNNKFELAENIIKSETEKKKPRGGPNLIKNCWRLIGSAVNEVQTEKLYKLLVERGYCTPSNIILGPRIGIHLKKNNFEKAVKMYKECCNRYKCTPLQLELLIALVKAKESELLEEVLNVTSMIHGTEATAVSFIFSLAENGLFKSLQKFLLQSKVISIKEIEKRCERWVKENKLLPLETLTRACHKIPHNILDSKMFHPYIMQIYSINNDCESAINFYRDLLEKEEQVPSTVINELLNLVHRCKYEIPESLNNK